MQWKPFQFRGKVYDLAHLHPRSATYMQPAKGVAPARVYRVDVIFGLHCFTRGRDQIASQEKALWGRPRDKSFRLCSLRVVEATAGDHRGIAAAQVLPHRQRELLFGGNCAGRWRNCRIRHFLCRFSVERQGKDQLVRSERVRSRRRARIKPAGSKADWLLCDSVQHAEQQGD